MFHLAPVYASQKHRAYRTSPKSCISILQRKQLRRFGTAHSWASKSIAKKLNMANIIVYPPKPAAFTFLQNATGYSLEQYRTTGNPNVNFNNAAVNAAIAARTQPVAGLPPFAQGPAPRSAAARALRDAAIANRGNLLNNDGMWLEDSQPPRPTRFQRGGARIRMNQNVARQLMARLNISFVKQLGWVSRSFHGRTWTTLVVSQG